MPWMWLLVNFALADTDSSGTYSDYDGDGWDESSDCDDLDPALNPGADELCDGFDNDCDARIDDTDDDVVGGATWADLDGDGYGDPLNTRCDAATGLDNDLDCDDHNATVNPDGTEICDGLENDCDAATSEDGTAAIDRQGFGSLAEAIAAAPSAATITVCGRHSGSYTVDVPLTVRSLEGLAAQLVPGGQDDIFRANDGAVLTLQGLELTGGRGALVGDERLGGAVYVGPGAEVTLSSCRLFANEATHGGAVAVDGGTLSITASEFYGNIATDLGGAVYTRNATLLVGDQVHMYENQARQGGGLAVREGSVTIVAQSASIDTNEATEAGGGLALFGDVAMLSSSPEPFLVAWNHAPLGGGIYVEGGSVDLPPAHVYDNTADDGGNAAIVSGDARFVDSEITFGSASRGGGVYVEASSVEIAGSSSVVSSNFADLGGGAYLAGPGARLVSTGAGWGKGDEDNATDDVYLAHEDGAKSYSYRGGDKTFECDASIPVCDPEPGRFCGCSASGAASGWLALCGLAAVTLLRRIRSRSPS